MERVINKIMLKEKIERDDSAKYRGDLLVRQRAINNAVASTIEGLLPKNALVIDACAGPEGSVLACSIRGWKWIGNDISPRFARDLRQSGARNVVVSNFPESPYADGSTDAVLFVFALNNICNTSASAEESKRITKEHGVVAIADPGPARWISSILTHQLINNQDLLNTTKRYEIDEYFRSKDYSEEEYVNTYCIECLGINPPDLAKIINLFYAEVKNGKDRKRAEYSIHETVAKIYYRNIIDSFERNQFQLEKSYVAGTGLNDSEWTTSSNPVAVENDRLLNELMEARSWKGEITKDLPDSFGRSQSRIIFPILVFKKR